MHYLIDYENISERHLTKLQEITSKDYITIFYTRDAKISLDALASIGTSNIVFFKVVAGKNALDFQLSSYLGYLIAKNENEKQQKYIIVSEDHGFDCLINFWKKRDVKITINRKSTVIANELDEKLSKQFSKIYKEHSTEIIRILHMKKLCDIHNKLSIAFGESGKQIYKTAKPYLRSN
ncbi:PIN domain-containing protein [Candidatus Enterococcus clewellii]|uniref:PIN-like domain-containing protein n=1 Tax=Candidatus Enterococcus clewellii TaxID=1834193 RepID=A0AAQ3VTX5_9ENTE